MFDSGDLGSFEELGERITAFRPHVVHLIGYGPVLDRNTFLIPGGVAPCHSGPTTM